MLHKPDKNFVDFDETSSHLEPNLQNGELLLI